MTCACFIAIITPTMCSKMLVTTYTVAVRLFVILTYCVYFLLILILALVFVFVPRKLVHRNLLTETFLLRLRMIKKLAKVAENCASPK